MSSAVLAVALETSSRVGGVALGRGAELVAVRAFDPGMRHARDLVPPLQALAEEHDLDLNGCQLAIVDLGPGSFTGLRVAVATVKALHLVTRCRVTSVQAPDAVAAALPDRPAHLCVVIDATRGEVSAACYEAVDCPPDPERNRFSGEAGVWQRTAGPAIVKPAALVGELRPECLITGGGLTRYGDEFRRAGFATVPQDRWLPRCEWVYRLGWERFRAGLTDDPSTLTPLYLRLPAAEERWRKLHGDEE